MILAGMRVALGIGLVQLLAWFFGGPTAVLLTLSAELQGDDVRAQAAQVGEQLRGITDQCKAAFGGT